MFLLLFVIVVLAIFLLDFSQRYAVQGVLNCATGVLNKLARMPS
jgi:hypothetical protein